MRWSILVALVAALLGSCSAAEAPPAPPPPPVPEPPPAPPSPPPPPAIVGMTGSPTAPLPFAGDPNVFAIGREFLFGSVSMTYRADRPRAFVILDPTDKGRGQKICRQFKNLPESAKITDLSPTTNVVSTYWPLTGQRPEPDACPALVARYDYAVGSTLRQLYHLKPRGTYLLAIDQNNRSFFIDISAGTEAQMTDVFQAWFGLAVASGTQPNLIVQSNNAFSVIGRIACDAIAPGSGAAIASAIGAGGIVGIGINVGAGKICKIVRNA